MQRSQYHEKNMVKIDRPIMLLQERDDRSDETILGIKEDYIEGGVSQITGLFFREKKA